MSQELAKAEAAAKAIAEQEEIKNYRKSLVFKVNLMHVQQCLATHLPLFHFYD